MKSKGDLMKSKSRKSLKSVEQEVAIYLIVIGILGIMGR